MPRVTWFPLFATIGFVQLAHAGDVPFTEHVVSISLDSPFSVLPADLDGDNDLDLLMTNDSTPPEIAWWENVNGDGSSFIKRIISTTFPDPRDAIAADIDDDGDLDVVAFSGGNSEIAYWWENLAGDGSVWIEHDTELDPFNANVLAADDLDGDGDIDVFAGVNNGSSFQGAVKWMENLDGAGTSWTWHEIVAPWTGGVGSAESADIDNDGDLDVAAVSFAGKVVGWFENDSGDGSVWTWHLIQDTFDSSQFLHVVDLDADGDIDVIAADRNNGEIWWWENDDGIGTTWIPHAIDLAIPWATMVTSGDLDMDGDLDIVASCYNQPIDDAIVWYENTAGDGTAWTRYSVKKNWEGPRHVSVADINGDGLPDIVSVAQLDNIISWWENRSLPPGPPQCPGDLDESGEVNVTDLLTLLADWGDCPQPCTTGLFNFCTSDTNIDCAINVTDLLNLLGSWGSCPVGACAISDGTCFRLTESECENIGGMGWVLEGECIDTDGDMIFDPFELNDCSGPSGAFIGTDPLDPNTDGDAFSDGEEFFGAFNGLDLPALGADPLRITLFVEIDWMNDSESPGFHSHRPSLSAINELVSVFSTAPVPNPCGLQGIDLIVDYGQGGLFTGGNLIGSDTIVLFPSEFDSYKSLNFDPNRSGFFRYAIFCHRYNSPSNNSSGFAEIFGDDFIVSLQSFLSSGNVSKTTMHELGHNLGLRHGGFENRNYKPNYNSIMNYRYQFPGIDVNCDAAGDNILNYSIGDRNTLNESSLIESIGVCGISIDWNTNGTIDRSNVTYNINCPTGESGACGTQPGDCYDSTCNTLIDFDDWSNLYLPIPAAAMQRDGDTTVECQDVPLSARLTRQP